MEAKLGGDGEVHLIRGDGELASDRAPDLDIDLGSIERRLVWHLDEIDAALDEHTTHHVFGFFPKLRLVDEFLTELFGVMGRKSHLVFLEAEDLEVLEIHLIHRAELLGELLLGAIDVRVVHVEGTHAHETEKLARLLVAVAAAIFRKAQREVAVATRFRCKNAMVVRAIHRLQVIALGLTPLAFSAFLQLHRRKHALGVVRKMAGGFIHFLFGEVRGANAHIAAGEFGLLGEFFEFLHKNGALRQPERHSGPDIFGIDGVEAHLGTDFAMVPLFGLFEHREVFLHRDLVFEGGSVNALELGIALIALVVGAGDMGELERANVTGAHHMGSGAEIGEFAVAEQSDRFALGDILDDIEFEFGRGASRGEGGEFPTLRHGDRVDAGDFHTLKNMVRLDLFFHLLLDPGEILGRDAVRQFDIVIEAILDRRTGGKLGLRPDFQDRRGEDMGGGMADAFEFSHGLEESFAGGDLRRGMALAATKSGIPRITG